MNEIFADHRFVECNNFLSRWRRRRKTREITNGREILEIIYASESEM